MTPTRVLVVEDDDDVRRSVCGILRYGGYEVTEATDGREAIDRLHGEGFDVLLLDLFMPNVDGAGVLDSLESDPVIILHSAFEYVSLAATRASYGPRVSAFLTKPVPPMDLLHTLEDCLERRAGAD